MDRDGSLIRQCWIESQRRQLCDFLRTY
jgi:hypothetical protein